MNLSAWFAAHKTQALLGGAGAVGAVALYRRSKTAASSTTAAPASSTTTTGGAAAPTYGYDSSQLDQYNQLAGAISNLNDQVGTLTAASAAGAAGTTPASGSGQGTWLNNPLGSQPGGSNEQAAFLGTENYDGAFYNVYNLGTLESQTGQGNMNWLSTLYPGQSPSQVWGSGNVAISPGGNEVAVPVFSGAGPLAPSGFIPKGPLNP